jgi:hypothetical protein
MTNRLGDVVKRMFVAKQTAQPTKGRKNVERFSREDKSSFVLIQGFLLRTGMVGTPGQSAGKLTQDIKYPQYNSASKRIKEDLHRPPRLFRGAEHHDSEGRNCNRASRTVGLFERGPDAPHCATILALCPRLVREPQISFLQAFSIKDGRRRWR